MDDSRWSRGYLAFPFVPSFENYNLKDAHDSYRVFLNGDYIGEKVLLSQGEDVTDIEDFLKSRGFKNVKTHLEGNQYSIIAEDAEEAHQIKNNLNVYLHLR